MSLICLGMNHQTAPLELLESVSLSHSRLEKFLSGLHEEEAIQEVVGLSTCNRMEVYLASDQPDAARDAVLRHLGAQAGEDEMELVRQAVYTYMDEAAAEHIFRVSAGIESLIIGEAQILGQLRRAFELARSLDTSGECLDMLLHRAISFGRRVRQETAIGRGSMSVASVACRIARQTFESLAHKELLLLGAGETAELAGRHFVKENIGRIRVLNRTPKNAAAMAKKLGGEAVPIDLLQPSMLTADIVVCAVGAPHIIVTRKGVAQTMRQRQGRPLLFIDISMPRNIDPEVASLEGVTLYAMDNLEEIIQGNRSQREEEIGLVEKLVKKETDKYINWAASTEQNQVAVSLRRRIAEIETRSLDKHFRTADPTLREETSRLTDSLLRAAFHDVTKYIRRLDPDSPQGQKDLETIKRIFALSESAPLEDEAR